MKVGKEEICGLVAAVERYVALDHAGMTKAWDETVALWVEGLNGLDGVQARRVALNEAGQPVPRLEITLEPDVTGLSADDVVERLWEATPRVAVLSERETRVYVTPDTLASSDDAELVLERLRDVLASSRDEHRE
jgi:L-seryl-tRNA(Ser) seleniumtransferase